MSLSSELPAASHQGGSVLASKGQIAGERGLGRVFVAFRPEIERFLRRRIYCPHLASDIASDLFMKLSRASDFRGTEEEARRYLFRMAANQAIDHIRVEKRRTEILQENAHLFDDVQPSAERGAIAKSELAFVDAALSELPEKARTMLVLSRVHGMTHAEIAQQMGVSKSLVEKYVLRALIHCRQRLKQAEEEDREQPYSA